MYNYTAGKVKCLTVVGPGVVGQAVWLVAHALGDHVSLFLDWGGGCDDGFLYRTPSRMELSGNGFRKRTFILMSANVDAGFWSRYFAPAHVEVIQVDGQPYDVEMFYLDSLGVSDMGSCGNDVARSIICFLNWFHNLGLVGNVLVFLDDTKEIERLCEVLHHDVFKFCPLHGSQPPQQQLEATQWREGYMALKDMVPCVVRHHWLLLSSSLFFVLVAVPRRSLLRSVPSFPRL